MSALIPLVCGWQEASDQPRAVAVAELLGVPVISLDALDTLSCAYVLRCDSEGLALQPCGPKAAGAVRADFVGGAVAHRRQFGGGQGQMIAKACGVAKGVRPRIADVTAGLGRDAFVLATLGCDLELVERSPVIHLLLQDGLQRAAQSDELQPILARMQLVRAEAVPWLQAAALRPEHQRPQVVYLDPMFPHRDKSALVKKEMLVFRDLVGDDADADSLLDAALVAAECRVVVKRPRKAPTLMQRSPSYQLQGKSSRFDVYALKKLS